MNRDCQDSKWWSIVSNIDEVPLNVVQQKIGSYLKLYLYLTKYKWIYHFLLQSQKNGKLSTIEIGSLWVSLTHLKNLLVPYIDAKLFKKFRFFQRGTLDLCRTNSCKVMSCQSWRFEKNSAIWPELSLQAAGLGSSLGWRDYL